MTTSAAKRVLAIRQSRGRREAVAVSPGAVVVPPVVSSIRADAATACWIAEVAESSDAVSPGGWIRALQVFRRTASLEGLGVLRRGPLGCCGGFGGLGGPLVSSASGQWEMYWTSQGVEVLVGRFPSRDVWADIDGRQ